MWGESASNAGGPGLLGEALWCGRALEAECSGKGDIVSSLATAPFCSYEAMRLGILQTSGLLAAAMCPTPPTHTAWKPRPAREHPHHIADAATFPRDHSLMVGVPSHCGEAHPFPVCSHLGYCPALSGWSRAAGVMETTQDQGSEGSDSRLPLPPWTGTTNWWLSQTLVSSGHSGGVYAFLVLYAGPLSGFSVPKILLTRF